MGVARDVASLPAVTRAAVWHAPDDLRIEEITLPRPGPGELLVRVRACGLCASETMSWYMARKAPVALGHEPAVEVVAAGDGVDYGPGSRLFVHHHAPCFTCRACGRGDYVHCQTWRATKLIPGGLSEYALVPAHVVRGDTRPIPARISDEEAIFVEPLACVVKSLRRARLRAGDRVLIIGAGVMGLLHLLLARRYGASVMIADRVASRLRTASLLGASATVEVTKSNLASSAQALTDGEGADVVIVGPGSAEAIEAGYRSAAPGGVVVLFTPAPPDVTWPLPVHDVYFREVTIVPSYSCGPDDTAEALTLLEAGLSVESLITHRLSLDQAAYGYRLVREATDALKVIVHP